jgi:AraC-like DNA-binding protein
VRIGLVLSTGFSFLKVAALVDLLNSVNQIKTKEWPPAQPYSILLLSQYGGALQSDQQLRTWTDRFEADKAEDFRRLFRLEGDVLLELDAPDSGVLYARQYVAGTCRETAGLSGQPLDAVEEIISLIQQDYEQNDARRLTDFVQQKFGMHPLLRSYEESNESKIRASATWLIENLAENISVKDVAQRFFMSERNYLRRFRDTVGTTPSEFLLNARLNRVCDLVAQSNIPLEKLARHCGFRDGRHLARVFKAKRLTTLSEYRRTLDEPAPQLCQA